MKKALFMCLITCVLVACGKNTDTTDSVVLKNPSDEKTETAQKEVSEGYYFETKGVKIIPDMEAKELLDALGEPISYFEANSCAFGDQDKVWTYSGFIIDTYQLDGVDYIYDVIFTDDTAETPEGIYLGMTTEDVIKAYGQPQEESDTKLLYRKGNMKLIFITKEGKVISIEYDSMVLG